MNQRGMGAAGAIAAMVIAGLVVYGLIYYGPDIWRGIQEGASGGGATSLKSITQNPEAYENQQVTVIGKIAGYIIMDDEGYYFLITNLPSNFSPDVSLKYNVSGKVAYVQTIPGTEEWGQALAIAGQDNYWAIEISDVRKI